MDWPGYSGWEATPVYQDEIDILKKEWSIPLTKKDLTFVYDRNIINKETLDEPQSKDAALPPPPKGRVKKAQK